MADCMIRGRWCLRLLAMLMLAMLMRSTNARMTGLGWRILTILAITTVAIGLDASLQLGWISCLGVVAQVYHRPHPIQVNTDNTLKLLQMRLKSSLVAGIVTVAKFDLKNRCGCCHVHIMLHRPPFLMCFN
jgi:hypothetical protein